jgi:glycosyltransferase involved in cell wall biosynthesis
MKILMAHNFYQQVGGEDMCFQSESDLLRDRGHDLETYTVHNDAIKQMSGMKAARLAIWNRESNAELSRLIQSQKPDIVHFHNTFPLMSPAAFWAAKAHGCAVVKSLHNYRLICPVGTFYRSGRVCEDCAGHPWPWPGVIHGCYRNSRPASAVVASMTFMHRVLRTWSDKVDRFIALSEFARRKFIEHGIPAEKIALKPNFLDPDPGPGKAGRGYAVFAGRLSPEKGIETLLAAWKRLATRTTLRIMGDGPLLPLVQAASSQSEMIEYLGYKPWPEVMDVMANADFLIMPSVCYENFGLAIIEAFAKAKPVIASRLGTMIEFVKDDYTGLHFEPGDPDDLAAKVTWAIEHPAEMQAMGQNGRVVYLERYGAERNYQRLMEIYQAALTSARGCSTPQSGFQSAC